MTQGVVCDVRSEVQWGEVRADGQDWITVKSNSIPQYPVEDYCPFGIGGMYCGVYKKCPSGVWGIAGELCIPEGSGIELDWGPNDVGSDRGGSDWGTMASITDDCPNPSWLTRTCPQNMPQTQGDCLEPANVSWKIPANPLPVRQSLGPAKYNRLNGVALDGVPIEGPEEAGGLSLDEANIVKNSCNGHPTPGHAGARYHYHKSPHCSFTDTPDGSHYAELPGKHSPLLGLHFDGFGLFGHQDESSLMGGGGSCRVTCEDGDCSDNCSNGLECHCGHGWWTGMDYCKSSGDTGTCESKPITDECNGHFGPTSLSNDVDYHYHVRVTAPYTLGCMGPSWQQCEELHQSDTKNYCSEMCDAKNIIDGLCVQTGYETAFNTTGIEFGAGYTLGQESY